MEDTQILDLYFRRSEQAIKPFYYAVYMDNTGITQMIVSK